MASTRRRPLRAVAPRQVRAAAGEASETIRIVLADDDAMFRRGLRARLESQQDLEVTGEAALPDEAVVLCETTAPHVLLLDIAMAGGQGMMVIERLQPLRIRTRILMLTAAITRADLVRALQLGAHGVLLKDSPTDLLFKSIRRVRAGEFWIGRDMVGDVVHALAASATSLQRTPPGVPPRAFALTARELEIVAAVASGYSNRQMAEKFGVAEDIIKHHLTSIFDKTGVSSRLELALFAIHHRLA